MEKSPLDISQLEFSIFESATLDLTKKIQNFNKNQLDIQGYEPIENIKYRIKSPQSIMRKLAKKNLPLEYNAIIEHIQDIAGIRIICSFVDHIYSVLAFLKTIPELEVLTIKDYVKDPKPNGYRSLHIIVKTLIHFNDYEENVIIELQIRTVAMDFWATLEHKLIYKSVFSENVHLIRNELNQYAHLINRLDCDMTKLKNQVMKGENQDETITHC